MGKKSGVTCWREGGLGGGGESCQTANGVASAKPRLRSQALSPPVGKGTMGIQPVAGAHHQPVPVFRAHPLHQLCLLYLCDHEWVGDRCTIVNKTQEAYPKRQSDLTGSHLLCPAPARTALVTGVRCGEDKGELDRLLSRLLILLPHCVTRGKNDTPPEILLFFLMK